MERVHIIVSGLVQGVFFRMNTCNKAKELGLTGWVRNLPTGEVEAVAEGPRNSLEEFAKWCGDGPECARVDGIRINWDSPTGSESDFHIAAT
jgi:acylphosphatase